MTTITLPPLPLPHFGAPWNPPMVFTEDQLRARDLEVARLVLEEAAKLCRKEAAASVIGHTRKAVWQAEVAGRCAAAVDALEVKHHE
jgi:hypothetical protein